ncbi:hypothetical protein B296_00050938 [Ensete ventricosum]|uniref:Uncharacterized protein n=1 Tax=Ensete ventricosum TaxID=4639 RepID=A0A426XJF5_ENSVE|nr:hypothetical protein B296_00050938 [Ensete ventricosum]
MQHFSPLPTGEVHLTPSRWREARFIETLVTVRLVACQLLVEGSYSQHLVLTWGSRRGPLPSWSRRGLGMCGHQSSIVRVCYICAGVLALLDGATSPYETWIMTHFGFNETLRGAI